MNGSYLRMAAVAFVMMSIPIGMLVFMKVGETLFGATTLAPAVLGAFCAPAFVGLVFRVLNRRDKAWRDEEMRRVAAEQSAEKSKRIEAFEQSGGWDAFKAKGSQR